MRPAFRFVRDTGIWAPIAVLVFHAKFSVPGWNLEIDWLNHYSGGAAITYFTWKCIPLFARVLGEISPAGRIIGSFLAGCTAALLWEIGEFSSDLVLDSTIQKSLQETMTDIVNGFLGIATVTLILSSRNFASTRKLPDES